eukprot:TRINITY_DN1915_c0_g1_i1.p1 TRINITY_DN1915_c0_g1~~TRINITY_DN1915_c0_g1_i1.p1  ORF type:complete len:1188 (-),score=197.50 TRINITY_DN1915_c0_g1_i1:60-3191(-)
MNQMREARRKNSGAIPYFSSDRGSNSGSEADDCDNFDYPIPKSRSAKIIDRIKHRLVTFFSVDTIQKLLTYRMHSYPVAFLVCLLVFLGTIIVVCAILFRDAFLGDETVYWWAGFIFILIMEIIVLELLFGLAIFLLSLSNLTFPLHYITKNIRRPMALAVWATANRFSWQSVLDNTRNDSTADVLDNFFEVVLLFAIVHLVARIGAQVITLKMQNVDLTEITTTFLNEKHNRSSDYIALMSTREKRKNKTKKHKKRGKKDSTQITSETETPPREKRKSKDEDQYECSTESEEFEMRQIQNARFKRKTAKGKDSIEMDISELSPDQRLKVISKERAVLDAQRALAVGRLRKKSILADFPTYDEPYFQKMNQMREARRKNSGAIPYFSSDRGSNSGSEADDCDNFDYPIPKSRSAKIIDRIKHRLVTFFSVDTIQKLLTYRMHSYPVAFLVCLLVFLGTIIVVCAILFRDAFLGDETVYWWAGFIFILIMEIIVLELLFGLAIFLLSLSNLTFPLHYITKNIRRPMALAVWATANRFSWQSVLDNTRNDSTADVLDNFFEVVLLFAIVHLVARIGAQVITLKMQNVDLTEITTTFLNEKHTLQILLNYHRLKGTAFPKSALKDGNAFLSMTLPGADAREKHISLRKRFSDVIGSMYRLNIKHRVILDAADETKQPKMRDMIKVDDLEFSELLDLWMIYHKTTRPEHFRKGKFFQAHTFVPRQFAKEVATVIFANLDLDGKKYLDEQDFIEFFPPSQKEQASAAFVMYDKRGTGFILLHECTDKVLDILQRRLTLANTLTDRANVSGALRRVANVVAVIVSLFLTPFVFGTNLTTVIQTLSFFVLGFSFAFGNALRVAVEGFVFIFIQRPYDVGDIVHVDTFPKFMYVAKINILTTEFFGTDGRGIVIPNRVMYERGLYQMTRSRQCAAMCTFEASVDDIDKFWTLRDLLVDWMRTESLELYHHEEITFLMTNMPDLSRVEIYVKARLVNYNWADLGPPYRATNDLIIAIITNCKKLGIAIVRPIQPVDVMDTGNFVPGQKSKQT